MELMIDVDMEMAKELKERKKQQKERDFYKQINKKDLNGFELDELFGEEE
jgi:hypothetical protein